MLIRNTTVNNIFLSFLTVIFLSAPFFQLHCSWTALIAFLPYLILMNNILKSDKKSKARIFFAYSLLIFSSWNIITTWWVSLATVVGAVAAIVFYTLFMSLTMLISFHIAKRNHIVIAYISFIVNWLSFEYILMNSQLPWPWLVLGNSFANSVEIIQWYEFVGHLGGSFWILLVNILCFEVIRTIVNKKGRKQIILTSSFLVFFVIAPITYSLVRYNSYTDKGYDVDVVVVQPNIDPYHEKFDGLSIKEQIDIILNVAEKNADNKVDYFIAPETAIPNYMWENDFNGEKSIKLFRNFMQKYPQAEFITGASTRTFYSNGIGKTETSRRIGDSEDFYDVHNTSLQIDTSMSISTYHKSKLVPGAESMPFPHLLQYLQDLLFDLGGMVGTNAGQEEREVFKNINNDTKVAVPICYESVFGEFVGEFSANGANFIAIITNDGWWGNTPGYVQHNSFARIRAIESRKSIARSANTGISSFINQRGDVISYLGWEKRDALRSKIKANDTVTFYAKNGDFIAKFSIIIAAGIILFTIISTIIMAKKKKKLKGKK